MKNIALILALYLMGNLPLVAQKYPLESAANVSQLVTSPDLAQLKLMIFDDTYVYADRFVYFAVVLGLAKDKVPVAIARSVAEESVGTNFVDKCQVCEATRKAFLDYSAYGATYDSKKNPYPDLASEKADLRHAALKNLVDKYTSSFTTLLDLSTVEQERLQNALGHMRKQGMSGMKSNFGSKSCPSCDGATHAY